MVPTDATSLRGRAMPPPFTTRPPPPIAHRAARAGYRIDVLDGRGNPRSDLAIRGTGFDEDDVMAVGTPPTVDLDDDEAIPDRIERFGIVDTADVKGARPEGKGRQPPAARTPSSRSTG
jgi:hypothetical protein